MIQTLKAATKQVEAVLPEDEGIQELVADKGYYSTERIVDLKRQGLRTHISEPRQGTAPVARATVGASLCSSVRNRGDGASPPAGAEQHPEVGAASGERIELGFLIWAAMRVGTPRGLQDRARSLTPALIQSLASAGNTLPVTSEFLRLLSWLNFSFVPLAVALGIKREKLTFATGC